MDGREHTHIHTNRHRNNFLVLAEGPTDSINNTIALMQQKNNQD